MPALNIFETSLRRGKFDDSRRLSNGSLMEFSHIYPMDAVFDVPADVPADVSSVGYCCGRAAEGSDRQWAAKRGGLACLLPSVLLLSCRRTAVLPQVMENKRYAGNEGWTVSECAAKVAKDWGKVDVLVHSLANGPEVQVRGGGEIDGREGCSGVGKGRRRVAAAPRVSAWRWYVPVGGMKRLCTARKRSKHLTPKQFHTLTSSLPPPAPSPRRRKRCWRRAAAATWPPCRRPPTPLSRSCSASARSCPRAPRPSR